MKSETSIQNLSSENISLMMRFGKPSNTIGGFTSKAFIELPFGMVKRKIPDLLKNEKPIEVISLIMNYQFPDFSINKATGNEVISFIIWIKQEIERLNKLEIMFLSTEPEPEMIAAGLHLLNEFGVMTTIDSLAKGNILEYEKIEALPYYKVYQKMKLDKIQKDIEKKYQKIMESKNTKK